MPSLESGAGVTLASSATPVRQLGDRVAESESTLGECVRPGVVMQRQAGQDAGRLKLAQAGSEHVRWRAEVALEVAVPLRAFEETFHDEECPSCPDDFQSGGEVAHAVGSASDFIQNGE